jgi:hypothetical protein
MNIILLKIGLLTSIATLSFTSIQAQDTANFKLPEGYALGRHELGDNLRGNLLETQKKGQDILVFMVSNSLKIKPSVEDIWFVSCSKRPQKGLFEFGCRIEKTGFTVDITSSEEVVFFGTNSSNSKNLQPINYKIDSYPIVSIKYPLLMPSQTYSFVKKLRAGNKLDYSWKEGQKYSTKSIDLTGFKEAYDFAYKTVFLNK